mgnify:CR=1 FL=1
MFDSALGNVGNVQQTVDTANDVGAHASLAFHTDGVAHVSYYDEDAQALLG